MIEENIKRIKDYLETEDIIEEFCERVITEYKKYDNLCNNVYKNLDFNETKITPSISITGSGDYSAIISCEDSFQDKTFSELNYLNLREQD